MRTRKWSLQSADKGKIKLAGNVSRLYFYSSLPCGVSPLRDRCEDGVDGSFCTSPWVLRLSGTWMKLDRSSKFQIGRGFVQQLTLTFRASRPFLGKATRNATEICQSQHTEEMAKETLNTCVQTMTSWCGKGLSGLSKSYLWPLEKCIPSLILFCYDVECAVYAVCCLWRDARALRSGGSRAKSWEHGDHRSDVQVGEQPPEGRMTSRTEAFQVPLKLDHWSTPPGGTSFWAIQTFRDSKN